MTAATPAFDLLACPLQGTQLIEASAGTGKTWTLCGLYLRLLLERGLPVSDILVMTFTNAATAELRERIRTRIVDTLARLRSQGPPDAFTDKLLQRQRDLHGLDDDTLARRLDLALQSFDEAAILTIHGFCQRALAEAPFTAGMPLQQTLLADDSALRLQVVHDFWRRRIAGPGLSPDLAGYLLDCRDTPQRLAGLLQRRLDKPLADWRWPAALDAPIALPPRAERDEAFAEAQALWRAGSDEIEAIVREAMPRLPQNIYKPETLDKALYDWRLLFTLGGLQDRLDRDAKYGLLGSHRLKVRKNEAPVPPHPFFDAAQRLLDLCAARAQALDLQRLQLWRELVAQGPAALRQAKREQRVQSFDDMLSNLQRRLQAPEGPALAAMLRRRFAAALVDEFQDTDPQQYAILQALYSGQPQPLCLVGDPKQAIYRFRNADLHTYLQARADAQAESTLDQNQRSSEPLIAALNGLFGHNPRAFMLDGLLYPPVRYGEKKRVPLHGPAVEGAAALQLWQLPRDAEGQPLPRAEALRRAQAATAAEIARLLTAAQAGTARLGDRALGAGDIAVLVRSHAQAAAMRRALAAACVGSVELSQASVFDSPDAADLAQLLAAILEPQRETLLRAALATEAMGHDAAALHTLDHDEAGLLAVMARFAGYRELWLARGVGRMLREWMRAEGVAGRLLQGPDGERRLTNLRHLAELLHEAAAEQAAPEALLRWLQQQRSEARRDDTTQLRLESDSHLVQVVTIHKSKGLEYPLVFCPLLFDGHTPADAAGDGLEYHEDGRTVIDFRELDAGALKALKQTQQLEAAAEQMRLIYVALTRAVHRCTLVVGTHLAATGHGPSSTQSCRARLHWLVAGQGMTPAQWLAHALPPEAIDAAWAALAQAQAPQVGLAVLPEAPARLAGTPPLPEALAALPPPARLPAAWWIGSYSSLAHGARHEAAAVDHDQRAPQATEEAALVVQDEDDILRFPRGAAAGECLHAVFETIDFTAPAGWPAAVQATLRRHAPALPAAADAAAWPRMLLRMLHDVLHTPVADGLRLAEVPAARCQAELEFSLPAHRLDATALTQVLHRAGQAVPTLQFGRLDGYLRGFIDLVFEHGGRYYLLDWKSNHLGETPADYADAALARTMAQQGYHLQALLYALALHRHLGQRLPGYRYERHFGGALYLFVRGVRPGWTQADGHATGVHLQRPPLALLQALSALCDGEGLPA